MQFDRAVLEAFLELDGKPADLECAWKISERIQSLRREQWPQFTALLITGSMNKKLTIEVRDALGV